MVAQHRSPDERREGSGGEDPARSSGGSLEPGDTAPAARPLRDVRPRYTSTDERLYRLLAQHADEALMLHEGEALELTFLNRACSTIWGRGASELADDANGWQQWIDERDRFSMEEAYRQAMLGRRLDEEFRIRHPNGDLRWVRATSIARGSGAPASQLVVVLRDISEERIAREQLQHLQRVQLVGTLATSIAHDFNNMLQAIVGCLNVVREGEAKGAEADDYLERALNVTRRGSELITQLTTFARRRETKDDHLELDAMLHRSLPLVQSLVTRRISVSLRTGSPGAFIRADTLRVQQILLNLAANARDAIAGSGTFSMHTELVPASLAGLGSPSEGTAIRLVIADSGRGMSEETKSRLFEPFFTTKEPGHGTGVGLWMVSKLLGALGASIEVQSEEGHGTQFIVLFPCVGSGVDDGVAGGDEKARAFFPASSAALPRIRHDPVKGNGLDGPLKGGEGPSDAAVEADAPKGGDGTFQGEGLTARASTLAAGASSFLLADETAVIRTPRTKTLLLVEDDLTSRLALSELLHDDGFRVLAAASPEEALRVAADHAGPMDLLLVDLGLPTMRGDELAQRLQHRYPDVPVVFMSGSEPETDSPSPLIRKPIELEELTTTLRRALSRAASSRYAQPSS